MPKPVTIDVVSDITCPWCAIGISALQRAIDRTQDAAEVSLRIHPFELNPDMPAGGRNIVEHLGERLNVTPEQLAASREMLKARAAEVDFVMATNADSRIYNTFDAHRLIHWAGLQGRQPQLKRALLEANFTHGQNMGDPDVLAAAAEKAGLDPAEASEVLSSGRYADEVRAEEHLWISRGINSVPAIVFNERYLVSGAQPVETFEQVIRQVAGQVG
ncbi:MAG: DsbA family oxidoreductase [Sphingobium sp.]|nr:DsbA family oxidoreductase [Sphingobium sp.]